jgi:hypothetical protein
MFSSYNKGVDDSTTHIMVCTTRAQKHAGLLGGLSGLPAPLSGGIALACARKSLRRRLTPFSFLTFFISLFLVFD